MKDEDEEAEDDDDHGILKGKLFFSIRHFGRLRKESCCVQVREMPMCTI